MRDLNRDNPERVRVGTIEYNIDLPDLEYLTVTPMEDVESLANKKKMAKKLKMTVSQFQLELENATESLDEAILTEARRAEIVKLKV